MPHLKLREQSTAATKPWFSRFLQLRFWRLCWIYSAEHTKH